MERTFGGAENLLDNGGEEYREKSTCQEDDLWLSVSNSSVFNMTNSHLIRVKFFGVDMS